MAKVMISLPDELLARVDDKAKREHSSRSAVIREFANLALKTRGASLAADMKRLNRQASGHGGDVSGELKAGRPE